MRCRFSLQPGIRSTSSCVRRSPSPLRRGRRSGRTHACAGTRRRPRSRTSTTPALVTVFPGIGYSSPDMSHFTSRHYWEVGATETGLETGWLGRYLDAVGSPTNPLQGLSMDGQINPTLATARNPVAAIDRPEDFSLWLNGVWGDIFSWTLDSASGARGCAAALGRSRRSPRSPRQPPRWGSSAARWRRSGTQTAAPPTRARSPIRNPARPTSPATCGARRDDRRRPAAQCVALTADAQFDTHSAQVQPFDSGLSLVADSIAAFQADLRGARDRRPGARARLVGVRTPRAGERLGRDRPRRSRRLAADRYPRRPERWSASGPGSPTST